HPYFQQMIYSEMKNFFEHHVLPYKDCFSCEINFIGSIAFIYEDILRAAAAYYNLNIGAIVQKPIENLVDYHRKYILNFE
ncbi:MAG: ATPase, partial [Flavobacteriaceae bacterium]